MADLAGKNVVIVGGAGLLGSAFSRACAIEGANVIVADIDAKKGEALAKEISGRFEKMDISDPASIDALAKKMGVVDGVINAAYPKTKNFGKHFKDAAIADMLADLSLHIGGCLAIAKAFAPKMESQKDGSIVFMGSIYGVVAPRFQLYEGTSMTIPAEYAAIKGGVIALTRYFASLFGQSGIRVNAISPGGIADGQPANFVQEYSRHLKIGSGLLAAEDISGAVIYLLSDASKQMTGQNIVIDGGWSL